MKSHVRQHYIPQFILKNFYCDAQRSTVNFYDIETEKIDMQFVANTFKEDYLYSNAGDLIVENSLSRFELEVAPLFKRLSVESEIHLTMEEDDKLRIFLSLLAFRSVNTRNQFRDRIPKTSKAIYGDGSTDFDFEKLWLKNVELISKCRNIQEITENPQINDVIKMFIKTEFLGFYMCILERRGGVDFVISDCYPAIMNGEGETPDGKPFQLPIYYFYPISDSRLILLVTQFIADVPRGIAQFDMRTVKGPRGSFSDKSLVYTPSKIYFDDVEWVNEAIINNASVGVVVKDRGRRSSHLNI
ncbi:MAG: DUF4238 domain-containing protein [Roseburia sp.]|nr:DUF4238 domain-containing protein [Roseburia sp.]